MTFTYKTQGTCSREINITVENDTVKEVSFVGGCNGNLKGIGALVKDMPVEEAIARLEGICCGPKNTSCPDQLAKALKTLRK
ncbi:MAG: TIGR03905 family TSCPD domain-containing protein [Oscillospiraceae bacterium]|nr:TIGR03905 family TSCPD domain-containing protein [Oscillospiraceae bacterium]